MADTKIVRDLLAKAVKSMAGIESARLDAEILLASSMNIDRTSLYAYPEREVPDQAVTHFDFLLSRRNQHYPVAYLIGSKEFWSLKFKVDRNTLIPRPETECLVETALEFIPENQTYKILDLGTGSGAIALAIARERPETNVLAIDLSEEVLQISRDNAREHDIANVEFLRSDWFSELQNKQFNMIVCNPPYVESSDSGFTSGEIRHEPRLALDGGQHGMQVITYLIPAARKFLKPKGQLILEHGKQQAKDIRDLFTASRYQEIYTRQDYAGLDRLSFAQRI